MSVETNELRALAVDIQQISNGANAGGYYDASLVVAAADELDSLQAKLWRIGSKLSGVIADTFIGHNHDILIANIEAAFASLARERDELRKIIDRLPKTADGVSITPGDVVWAELDYSQGKQVFRLDVGTDGIARCSFLDTTERRDPTTCFSTRSAAESAKAKEAKHGE